MAGSHAGRRTLKLLASAIWAARVVASRDPQAAASMAVVSTTDAHERQQARPAPLDLAADQEEQDRSRQERDGGTTDERWAGDIQRLRNRQQQVRCK
jgi:hypothetical protein